MLTNYFSFITNLKIHHGNDTKNETVIKPFAYKIRLFYLVLYIKSANSIIQICYPTLMHEHVKKEIQNMAREVGQTI